MNVSLYYAALEHGDEIDPEVVMPNVSWKTGKARQHVHKATTEPCTL